MTTATARAWKKKNLEQGIDDMDVLIGYDFQVKRFSEFHYRIEDTIDIWPSTRKWRDITNNQSGRYESLIDLIQEKMKYEQTD